MLQLHQGAGATERRDAVRLRHQRLQPHLPQLQGETQVKGSEVVSRADASRRLQAER